MLITTLGGGGFKKLYVDVPVRRQKSDFLYTNFLLNFPPFSTLFSKEKHPILTKLGAFYNNLPKIHPIYVIWAPSTLMKTPDRYTKFREKAPPSEVVRASQGCHPRIRGFHGQRNWVSSSWSFLTNILSNNEILNWSYINVRRYSKRYHKLAPTRVWFTNIRSQSIKDTWRGW